MIRKSFLSTVQHILKLSTAKQEALNSISFPSVFSSALLSPVAPQLLSVFAVSAIPTETLREREREMGRGGGG